MPNQIFKNGCEAPQVSWSGTHGARRAVVIAPQDGCTEPLPVSGNTPIESAPPLGTVGVLCAAADVMAALRQNLAGANILLRQYFSLQTILSDSTPHGAACLLVDLEGLELADQLFYELLQARGRQLPVIVLVGNPAVRMVVQLMRAGAEDVLLRHSEPDELIASIRQALNKSRQTLHRRSGAEAMRRRWEQLRPREMEIVRLVLAGLLNKEIADRLNLALVTVKTHRASAMHKLGARNPAELARLTLALRGSGALFSSGHSVERAPDFNPVLTE